VTSSSLQYGAADQNGRLFDPITEHRWFCPWVQIEGGTTGWERLAKAVLQDQSKLREEAPVSNEEDKVDTKLAWQFVRDTLGH